MDWLIYIFAGLVGLFWMESTNQPHTGAKLASWTMVLSSVVSIGETSLWPLFIGWVITWVIKIIYGDPGSENQALSVLPIADERFIKKNLKNTTSEITKKTSIYIQPFQLDLADDNTRNNAGNKSYLLAMQEYDSNQRDKALWAKCFALSEGNETKTKALYVKERASTILRKYQPNSDNHINSLSNEMADLSISNNNNNLNIQNATRDIFIEGGINKSFYPSSDYSTASDKFLLKNRMFEVIKHKTIQIMLLKNGRAAVEVGDEIKVFENESRCKAARLNDKYPAGLMATIKLSDLDDDDAKKEKAAKKLNYKNFQELEDKVSKRIPVAMFDMANILFEHDVSSSMKQRALVLLESAAIHGHTEAKILWQHLRGESIKRP